MPSPERISFNLIVLSLFERPRSPSEFHLRRERPLVQHLPSNLENQSSSVRRRNGSYLTARAQHGRSTCIGQLSSRSKSPEGKVLTPACRVSPADSIRGRYPETQVPVD